MFNLFRLEFLWDKELCRSVLLVYSMETQASIWVISLRCERSGRQILLGSILPGGAEALVRPKNRMDVDFWVAREVGFFKSRVCKS